MTPPRVTEPLSARPAPFAVRVIAQARLEAACAALEQLDADTPDALHDLRVSLRRLRSWLRTFRPYVDDTVRRRTYRRLKRLVRATNRARDTEVWTEWLAEQNGLSTRDRAGARYLADWLEAEGARQHERSLSRAKRKLPKLLAALAEQLSTYSVHVRGGAGADHRMADAMADALRVECRRFQRRLGRAASLADVEAIHATRIAAKKLRYVVETLEPSDAEAVAVALSELQDSLGAVHDMQVLVEHLLDEIEFAGGADARRRARRSLGLEPEEDLAPPRRAVAGLTELARRAQARAEHEFLKFAETWNASRLEEIEVTVGRLAADLEHGSAQKGQDDAEL